MIRGEPCLACPYRRDVPSGVWAESEYEKLRDYDRPTGKQPFAVFACHATPEHLCAGWATVHMNRGHEHELLALRMNPQGPIPAPTTPLWGSGNEAADHGQRELADPGDAAALTMERLLRKHPRLRRGESP